MDALDFKVFASSSVEDDGFVFPVIESLGGSFKCSAFGNEGLVHSCDDDASEHFVILFGIAFSADKEGEERQPVFMGGFLSLV